MDTLMPIVDDMILERRNANHFAIEAVGNDWTAIQEYYIISNISKKSFISAEFLCK